MKNPKILKVLSFIMAVSCFVATSIIVSGCGDKEAKTSTESTVSAGVQELGVGKTEFRLIVTDKDGKKTENKVITDKETVGDALKELSVISGVDGSMFSTVNGQKLDYNADGYYWAFYIDGAYATTGVFDTKIETSKTYELRAEKA